MIRSALVDALFGLLNKLLMHPRGRELLRQSLPLDQDRCESGLSAVGLKDMPYPDVAQSRGSGVASPYPSPIIVSARFRTGSTLVWRLFRELPNMTAYYEPLNERRWFEPTSDAAGVDPTHKGVQDYWREYVGLSELSQYYQARWTSRDLYMGAASWDPNLLAYIETMIHAAPGRSVLQFNRIDFRLQWFKHHFPQARIIHLYRHPREQWVSTLHGDLSFPLDGTLREFVSADKFYLGAWSDDLCWQFPVLRGLESSHPYLTFYLLWRLSYLHGRRHGDLSVGYETLIKEPEATFAQMLTTCGLDSAEPGFASQRIQAHDENRRQKYAPDAWYAEHEAMAEQVLAAALGEISES
jgi:hypothetical protein